MPIIHAYNDMLKKEAAYRLGRMLDFSVHSLHMDIENVLALFSVSDTAAMFEKGDLRALLGMSGIELAYDMLDKCGITFKRTPARHTRSLSAEYHLGYFLATIQHSLSEPFSEILRDFSYRDFLSDYSKQRTDYLSSLQLDIEASERARLIAEFEKNYIKRAAESHMADKSGKVQAAKPGELLKNARIRSGLSQSELAKASGVPLRTLQQYEQGQKDIKKARAAYIVSLASVLNTEPSKLIHCFPF